MFYHLNTLTALLLHSRLQCRLLESQISSVQALTGNDTTYPLSDLRRRLHLPFQTLQGRFPKLHNLRLSKQMSLAWQMTGIHVTQKEASKITSSTQTIKIVIYDSFHRIIEEQRFFKEISEFFPIWFIKRIPVLFHSNSLAYI